MGGFGGRKGGMGICNYVVVSKEKNKRKANHFPALHLGSCSLYF